MIVEKYQQEFEKTIEHLKSDLNSLRTNRATSALVENILVEAYGAKTPLKGLANISISDPKTMVVEPWDKSIVKEVEKAIRQADTGIGIINEGSLIRLAIPPLTEEKRKELVKLLNQKLEQGRVSLRMVRDQIKEEIVATEKRKEITEDDKYKFIENLDKLTREYNDKIKEIGDKKEGEIMRI